MRLLSLLYFLIRIVCPAFRFRSETFGLLRRSSETETPNLSAISASVSPLRTVYFFAALFEARLDLRASPLLGVSL